MSETLNSRVSDRPEMLKPPWWAASLLLQHMVDELRKSRTLSESVKVGIRIHDSYRPGHIRLPEAQIIDP
jgi:hypothetical protein